MPHVKTKKYREDLLLGVFEALTPPAWPAGVALPSCVRHVPVLLIALSALMLRHFFIGQSREKAPEGLLSQAVREGWS